MLDKIKDFFKTANIDGLYLPMIRDPKSGMGSVSLTLVFISFNMCIIAMIGHWSGFFGGIDPQQALNLFMVTAGLYWGRKAQKTDKDITISSEKE